jgi:hypothetical protein
MDIECAYGFRDLYTAAHGRQPTKDELRSLYSLPQDKKNEVVNSWAKSAKWETKERKGSDGVTYLAFAPSFKKIPKRGSDDHAC